MSQSLALAKKPHVIIGKLMYGGVPDMNVTKLQLSKRFCAFEEVRVRLLFVSVLRSEYWLVNVSKVDTTSLAAASSFRNIPARLPFTFFFLLFLNSPQVFKRLVSSFSVQLICSLVWFAFF